MRLASCSHARGEDRWVALVMLSAFGAVAQGAIISLYSSPFADAGMVLARSCNCPLMLDFKSWRTLTSSALHIASYTGYLSIIIASYVTVILLEQE